MAPVQWNCNGFYARKPFLQLLLRSNSPACLCLQETNFKNDHCSKLKGYSAAFKNRLHQNIASGGVAVFTKSEFFIRELPLNSPLEVIAVRIRLASEVTICNLYLPPNRNFDLTELDSIVNQLPKPLLLVGDFNCHSPLLGSRTHDGRGKTIET